MTGGVLWQLARADGRPQDLLFAPRTSDADFTGAYADTNIGAILNFRSSTSSTTSGWGWHLSRSSFGGVAG